jgi:uncharacterized membrane protein
MAFRWFVGTVYFVLIQCAGVLTWVLLNAGRFHLANPFDPYPFSLLSVVLSMVAVLPTSFPGKLLKDAAVFGLRY